MTVLLSAALVILAAFPIFAQPAQCNKTADTFVVRGVHLGMTEAELYKNFPKLKKFESRIYRVSDGVGKFEIGFDDRDQFSEVLGSSVTAGLANIEFQFLGERLARIEYSYDDGPSWPSVIELTDAIAGPLGLPRSSNWKPLKDDKHILTMSCKDFELFVILHPRVGQYEVRDPRLRVSIPNYFDELARRRKEAVELKRKNFKP